MAKWQHFVREYKVAQLCLTLQPYRLYPPGSSLHGFSRQEYWSGLPVPSSRGSSRARDWTLISYVSCIGRRVLYHEHYLGSPYIHKHSDGKESACNVGDLGLIPGSGRPPGEGNGNRFQYSCLVLNFYLAHESVKMKQGIWMGTDGVVSWTTAPHLQGESVTTSVSWDSVSNQPPTWKKNTKNIHTTSALPSKSTQNICGLH